MKARKERGRSGGLLRHMLAFLAALLLLHCGSGEPLRIEGSSLAAEVRDSCRTIVGLLGGAPDLAIEQTETIIIDHRQQRQHEGCRVTASSKDLREHVPPHELLRIELPQAGWKEDIRYGADGKDGTAFALRKESVLCLIQASWDDGDDSNPSYVPRPWYKLRVGCFTAPEGSR